MHPNGTFEYFSRNDVQLRLHDQQPEAFNPSFCGDKRGAK